MTLREIIQIFAGFFGCICFGILFNIRGKKLVVTTLGGLVSWTLYLLFRSFIRSEALNYFVVAFIMSGYAEFMARKLKTPTTTFIATSLIPLIPGGSLYYTMAYAVQSDYALFAGKAVYTLQLAAALALGVIAAAAATQIVLRIKGSIRPVNHG